MIVLALALLVQASSAPVAQTNNGPVVRLDPEHMTAEMLSHYPVLDMGDHRVVIFGIYLDGDLAVLEQIKVKLVREGWNPGLVTPPERPTGLSIPSLDKKFDEMNALIERMRAKEFGDVQFQPLTERIPATK